MSHRSLHGQIMREAAVCSRMKPKKKQPSWYCDQCHVEVRQLTCPHCGKTEKEKS
jgi:hypothetical protein